MRLKLFAANKRLLNKQQQAVRPAFRGVAGGIQDMQEGSGAGNEWAAWSGLLVGTTTFYVLC